MKVAVADTLSPLVDAAFKLAQPTLADSWVAAFSYTLQLYFDFAGYSLMAIGLARMIGFHFPQNFDNPYLSSSIQEFWQRWHMTLSRFLRDYLYISLGGNRLGPVRTYVNLMLVMVIGGFWHGSSWNFIIWGAWQGGSLALHRWYSRRRPRGAPAMSWLAGHLITMLVVMIGWVVFRAADLKSAFGVYAGMLGLHGVKLSDELAWQITPDRWAFIPIALVLVYLPLLHGAWSRRAARVVPVHAGTYSGTTSPSGTTRSNAYPAPSLVERTSSALQLVWPMAAFGLAMVLLYSRDAVPFLYFQF